MPNNLLKSFMHEHFDLEELTAVGILKEEWMGNYEKQAARICHYFGLKSIYEYGTKPIRCHVTYPPDERPLHIDSNGELKTEPFITKIPKKTLKAGIMNNQTEIRWRSGQEEYTVEEIEYMLQSQRAMLHNDIKRMIPTNPNANMKDFVKQLMEYLRNPRKVEI